jgi:hypothetical protein
MFSVAKATDISRTAAIERGPRVWSSATKEAISSISLSVGRASSASHVLMMGAAMFSASPSSFSTALSFTPSGFVIV